MEHIVVSRDDYYKQKKRQPAEKKAHRLLNIWYGK